MSKCFHILFAQALQHFTRTCLFYFSHGKTWICYIRGNVIILSGLFCNSIEFVYKYYVWHWNNLLLCYGRWQVHNILHLASSGIKYNQIALGSSNDQSCLIRNISSSVFFPPSRRHHLLAKMRMLTVIGFCIVLMKRTLGKSHGASRYKFAAGHRQMSIYLELSCCG